MPTTPTTYDKGGPIYLTGNMLASTGSEPAAHPGGYNTGQDGFGMRVDNPTTFPEDEFYRLVWLGNTGDQKDHEYFQNGPFWVLEKFTGGDPKDGANWVTDPMFNNLNPKNDLVQGMGATSHSIVFSQDGAGAPSHLIFDINGIPEPESDGSLFYLEEDPRDEFYFPYNHNDDNYPCFARGTMIDTPQGPRAIEDLAVGDLVLTADNGPQPIRWIGSKRLTAVNLMIAPKNRPIRIKAGALGEGLPAADLVVSPQHRVLVRSALARQLFGTDEVLVAAKQMLQLDGIDIATDMGTVEYFHMLFDRHEVVFSNGAKTESLYTGPEALKSVGRAAQREIFDLFPELRNHDHTPQGARMLASGRQGRRLVVHHKINKEPFLVN